jgi:hypothetical protein
MQIIKMEEKITENKWEIKSKNFFARAKRKKTQKDGEYYDIVFGLKGQKGHEMHAHFGIKAIAEKGVIVGKAFFIQSRKATSRHTEKIFNLETGELLSISETPYGDGKGKIGAELHYSTRYDKKEKKIFLTKFKIVEIG